MQVKYAKKLLLAKIEATAGMAEVLAATDAILAKDIELSPLVGGAVSRDLQRSYHGHRGEIQVNSHQTLAFKVELAGPGTKGIAPAWGKLLQGCGLAETLMPNVSAAYTPVSTGEKTLTLALNIDGQLHTLKGARGTFSVELGANEIPYLSFSFTGQWSEPTSTAAIANPVLTPFKDPLPAASAQTGAFTFFTHADLRLSAFSYEHANAITHRDLIGTADPEVVITDRAPTGSITVDAPKLSVLNLIKKARDNDTGALLIQHGKTDGEIIELTAPKVQGAEPSYGEADGILQLQLSLAFLPNATVGNDEFKLTAR